MAESGARPAWDRFTCRLPAGRRAGRQWGPALSVLALSCIGLTACGTDWSAPPGKGAGSPPGGVGSSANPSPAFASGGSHGSAPGTSQPASTGRSPTNAATGGSGATTTTIGTLALTLAKTCAHPGDTQTLTVRGAQPGARMIYDTTYSNDSSEINGHYTTGYGAGFADASGSWTASWVIDLTVPSGPATVTVAGSGQGFKVGRANYTIESSGTPCS